MDSEITTQELLRQILEDIDLHQEGIIAFHQVTMIKSKSKTKVSNILLTDLRFNVIKKKNKFRKSHSISRTFGWNLLTSISLSGDSFQKVTLIFSAKQTISFFDADPIGLVSTLFYHLNDIMLPTELPIFQFDKSIIKQQQLLTQQNAFLKRLRYTIFKTKRSLPQYFFDIVNSYNTLTKVCTMSNFLFDFSQIVSAHENFDIIFDALICEKNLYSVNIPKTIGHNWSSVGKLVQNNCAICEIRSMEEIENDFVQFVEKVSSNKNNNITAIHFSGNRFDEFFVRHLTSLIQRNPKIKTLTVENRFTTIALTAFINNFDTCVEYEHLTSLSLGYNIGLDMKFKNLISSAPNLRLLDLSYCAVDITAVFLELNSELNSIEVINLSGNKFLTNFDSNIKVSSKVNVFILRSIYWTPNNFQAFMCFISKHSEKISHQKKSEGLYLDVADIKYGSIVEYHSITNALKSTFINRLTTFVFDLNPANRDFIDFLENHRDTIEALSVTDCFSGRKDKDNSHLVFQSFLSYLGPNNKLTELVIRSFKKPFTVAMMHSLAEILYTNEAIEILDIQCHQIGDAICEILGDLIGESISISEVRLDRNNIQDIVNFETLETKILLRSQQFQLQIPKYDFKQMIKAGKSTVDSVTKAVNLAKRLQRPSARAASILRTHSIPAEIDDGPTPKIGNNQNNNFLFNKKNIGIGENNDENDGYNNDGSGKSNNNTTVPIFDFSNEMFNYVDDSFWLQKYDTKEPSNHNMSVIENIDRVITLDLIIASIK